MCSVIHFFDNLSNHWQTFIFANILIHGSKTHQLTSRNTCISTTKSPQGADLWSSSHCLWLPNFRPQWIGDLIKKVQHLAYQILSNPINISILPLILQFESTFPNIQVCFAWLIKQAKTLPSSFHDQVLKSSDCWPLLCPPVAVGMDPKREPQVSLTEFTRYSSSPHELAQDLKNYRNVPTIPSL